MACKNAKRTLFPLLTLQLGQQLSLQPPIKTIIPVKYAGFLVIIRFPFPF